MQLVIDVTGWLGAGLVILAYVLVSTKKTAGDALLYQLLNLAGGIFLIVNTVFYRAFPSTLVNAIWVVIALTTINRTRRRKRGSQSGPEAGGAC